MCGRIACLLDPQTICHACSPQQPQWRDSPSGTYYPGANKMPSSYCPVMYRAADGELVVQPMLWGLIPIWHKGDKPTGHGLTSNNARIETIETSKLYSRLIPKSRCIVVAQGFYEWKSIGAKKGVPKEPFFIYQDFKPTVKHEDSKEDVKSLREIWKDPANFDGKTWTGPPLLKMAGLYDVWKHGEGGEDKPVHSFTVITMESNDTISWLHDRMPAILETQEQCEAWLNGADLKTTLKQATGLKYYAVDTKVNTTRCHDEDCMDRKVEGKPAKGEAGFMANWLKRPTSADGTKKVKDEADAEEATESKVKKEEEAEDDANGDGGGAAEKEIKAKPKAKPVKAEAVESKPSTRVTRSTPKK